MTAAEFKAAKAALNLSARRMGERLGGISLRQVQRYCSGEQPVSGPVAELVRRLLQEANFGRLSL